MRVRPPGPVLALGMVAQRNEAQRKVGGQDMNTTTNKVLGVAMAMVASLSPAFSAGHRSGAKLSGDLREAMSIARDQRVIVTLNEGLRESSIQSLVNRAGATAKRFTGGHAFTATLSRRDIEALAGDDRVAHISPDRRIQANMDI